MVNLNQRLERVIVACETRGDTDLIFLEAPEMIDHAFRASYL